MVNWAKHNSAIFKNLQELIGVYHAYGGLPINNVEIIPEYDVIIEGDYGNIVSRHTYFNVSKSVVPGISINDKFIVGNDEWFVMELPETDEQDLLRFRVKRMIKNA